MTDQQTTENIKGANTKINILKLNWACVAFHIDTTISFIFTQLINLKIISTFRDDSQI